MTDETVTQAYLRLAPETVGREWRRARAWLYSTQTDAANGA